MTTAREEIIFALRKKGLKRNVPRPFLDCITTIFTTLGRWFSVPRTTWHAAYRCPTQLFWRRLNDEMLHIMTPSRVSGFFHFAGTTTTLPLDCHPIVFQQVGEAFWTHRPFLPGPTSPSHALPPGHMVENTLCHPTRETITLGSDGSVHLAQQVAACTWMIYDDAAHFARHVFYYQTSLPCHPIAVNSRAFFGV